MEHKMLEIEKQIRNLTKIKEDLIRKYQEKTLAYDRQEETNERLEKYLDEYESYILAIEDMIKELTFINTRIKENKELQ